MLQLVYFILIDELLLRKLKSKNGFRLSILSVGFGIYLPPEINVPLMLGTIIGHFIKRRYKDKERQDYVGRRGILFACGFIVGDSIFSILLAFIITLTGAQNPLALVGDHFQMITSIIGTVVFFSICYYFYRYVTTVKE